MSTTSKSWDRWRRTIQQQQSSGLSITAFCQRAGISRPSFYLWRRKLRQPIAFAEVKLAGRMPAAADSPRGRVMNHHAAEPSGEIELHLPGRRCLVVRPGFDRQTLVELLDLLEAASSPMPLRETMV
jgi:transposase-like protein